MKRAREGHQISCSTLPALKLAEEVRNSGVRVGEPEGEPVNVAARGQADADGIALYLNGGRAVSKNDAHTKPPTFKAKRSFLGFRSYAGCSRSVLFCQPSSRFDAGSKALKRERVFPSTVKKQSARPVNFACSTEAATHSEELASARSPTQIRSGAISSCS